jgi:hypothetical protein
MRASRPSVWNVDFERAKFGDIIDWCAHDQAADRILMVIRLEKQEGRWHPIKRGVEQSVTKMLGNNLLTEFMASGWPGTELVGHPARVVVGRFSEEVKRRLPRIEGDSRKWIHNNVPPLPEDICLFREGAPFPVFVSCTHEGDFWLVTDKPPKFPGVSRSSFKVEDLYVFSGDWFCKPWKRA